MNQRLKGWLAALFSVALVSGVLVVSANAHIGASHSPFNTNGPDLRSATAQGDDLVKYCFDEAVAEGGAAADYELRGYDENQSLGADEVDLGTEDECIDVTFNPPSEKTVKNYTVATVTADSVEDRGGDSAPAGAVRLDASTAPGGNSFAGGPSVGPNLSDWTPHSGAGTISFFFDENVDCSAIDNSGAADAPDAEYFGFYEEDESDATGEPGSNQDPEVSVGDTIADCSNNEIEVGFGDNDAGEYTDANKPAGGGAPAENTDVDDAERVFVSPGNAELGTFTPSGQICDPDPGDDGCTRPESSDEDIDGAPDLTDVERTDDSSWTYTYDENLSDDPNDVEGDEFFIVLADGQQFFADDAANDCDADVNTVECDFGDDLTVGGGNIDDMEDDEFAHAGALDCAVVSDNDLACSTVGTLSATSAEAPGITDAPDLEQCDIDDATDIVSYIFDEDVDQDSNDPDGGNFYVFDAEADETAGDAGSVDDVDGNTVKVEYQDEDLSDQIGCGVKELASNVEDEAGNSNIEATAGTSAASSTTSSSSTTADTTTDGPPTPPPPVRAATTVSIKYDKKPASQAAFKGSVSSKIGKCIKGRQIELHKKGGGIKGRDKSNDQGKWSIKKSVKKGKWFAVALKKVFTKNNGQVVTCKKDESPTISV